ncbi:uncharacterized protein IL334_006474 [Kwoniella shivajii]|uniref:White collar 2 protein n=1 Tax=Kwoniella shivajii TaxID=564305 RepID=A0ABZ1D622_9TREE|nr:hypothetical protein IL334_006474 [Kwoniella shivajii]
MSLLASSLAGANYMTSNNEDRESATNGAAEFTRRKKWPEILLKELVGGSIFCLKPVMTRKGSEPHSGTSWSWKIIYSSPAVGEMLGQKPSELEGKDFLDFVFAADHPQIQTFFHHLLTPSLPHHASSSTTITTSSNSLERSNPNSNLSPTQGDSQTTYVRMISASSDSSPGSGTGSSSNDSSTNAHTPSKKVGPLVWELRAHASGLGDELPIQGTENLGPSTGQGTVVQHNGDNAMKGKAIWVMGRKVGENVTEVESSGNSGSGNSNSNNGNSNGTGNNQSLDAFLELKLENEKLREELRELQLDLDEELPTRKSSLGNNTSPIKMHPYQLSSSPSSAETSPSSSRSSSPTRIASSSTKPKAKTGRPPKEGKEKEKKRKKSTAGTGKEGEGMHVCVTCGRTDSPEWRKGPLGPKTLCNACGLRWAKRNSTQPTRKDKKPNVGKN